MRPQYITVTAFLFYIGNVAAYPSIGHISLVQRDVNNDIAIRDNGLLHDNHSLISRSGINKALEPLRELLARSPRSPNAAVTQQHQNAKTTHINEAAANHRMATANTNQGDTDAANARTAAAHAHERAAAAHGVAAQARTRKEQKAAGATAHQTSKDAQHACEHAADVEEGPPFPCAL